MTDPQLTTLVNHCRREAAADRSRLAKATTPAASYDLGTVNQILRRIALWEQIADEIDAYLAGNLEDQPTDNPNQLTLG